MTQNKNIYDLPKISTVSYYDVESDQNLTAEEWNKLNSLNCSEEIIISKNRIYISEKAYNQGIAMYGPGFWDDVWEVTKFTGKFVATGAIGAAIVATGPFAIPLGAAVAAEGYCIKKASEGAAEEGVIDEDGWVRGVTEFAGDTVMGGGIGGITGGLVGTGSKSWASKGANAAFREGVRTAGTNGSKVLLNAWIYTKAAQVGYDLGSKGKSSMEGFCHYFHSRHKGNGVSYDSECPICNGNFNKFLWL